MKQTLRSLGPALAVLLALALLYAALSLSGAGAAQSEAANPTLYLTDSGPLSALSWEGAGDSLSFTRQDGTWYYSGDPDFPVNQSVLDTLSGTLSHLPAIRILEQADAPASYGLETPALQFHFTAQDGSVQTLSIGASVPGQSDQLYACLEGSGAIGTISASLQDTASQTLYDFLQTEQLPFLSSSDLTSVSRDMNGSIEHFYREASGDGQGSSWYTGPDRGHASLMADSAQASDLAAAVSALSIQSCYRYKADEAELTSCGLKEPSIRLSWTYQEDGKEKTAQLLVGSKTDDGTAYYTKLPDSAAVNRISAAAVEKCLAESAG